MKPSLSVILPVRNAAESLGPVVCRLLELLPDLTPRFEIVVVDDASTDHTAEIADELRRTYPQVRVVRHGWSWGTSAAVRTGRIESRGQHAIIVRSPGELNPREIVRQWRESEVAAADRQRSTPEPEPAPSSRLRRTESAHGDLGKEREPSFLKHLRQLSEL